MSSFRLLVALVLLALLIPACGPKPVPQESPLDTPGNHYQQGLAQLEQNDLWEAQREFERARALDPDYPGAYVGNALVALAQGEFWRARQEVEKALHRDADFVDAYLALGRIAAGEAAARGYGVDQWLPEALAAYGKAEKKAPDNPAVSFFKGQAYLQALSWPEARAAFSRVIELNRGAWVEKAMAALATIQQVERAAPGSKVGQRIALVPRLSRAELAVLLVEELKLPELIAKRGKAGSPAPFQPPGQAKDSPIPEVSDLEGCWAKPWIETVLSLGIPGLEVFPDHTFRPELPVTRANYALVNQSLLVLLSGDPSLATRYVGEASRFADVRSDFYAYNAIALATERGLMAADQRGYFRPQDPVSGAEALLIIRELQNAFRLEF